MLDLIASYMVKAFNRLFHVLPIQSALWFGGTMGKMGYYLSGRRGKITYANLKAAFSAEKDPAEIKRITKKVYSSVGQTFAELVALTKIDNVYIDKYVKINNIERIDAASKNPNGMILVSAHFGDWELCTAASVLKGYPLYVLARDQKMKRLNELLNLLRETRGNKVIRKGMNIKTILKVLKEGKSIGLLADQNAGPSGLLSELFGRPASTATGPYRFSQNSGASIILSFVHRLNGPYQEIDIEEPFVVPKGADIGEYVAKYNRVLEKHIRRSPHQWFWMHKKWKLTPLKKVIVLDDGKKGHLNQSLAIVELIKEFRVKEGYEQKYLDVEICRVRFKNRLCKVMTLALSFFSTAAFQLHVKLLKLVLDTGSYENIISKYADIVVSCGSSLSGLNVLLSRENHARNVAVLDPGPLLRKLFNIIVLPLHDARGGAPTADNTIITELAPNLVSADKISGSKKEMLNETIDKNLGVLIGGSNKYFDLSDTIVSKLAEDIDKMCLGMNAGLYLSTSRRTSDPAESILRKNLKDKEYCKLYVSGREDKEQDTVERIFVASDVVIVSGESISMVSEAVSSGIPVIVFMPKRCGKTITKYERFVYSLQQKGYLTLAEAGKINEVIGGVMSQSGQVRTVDDNSKITEKLYKLF